MFRVLATWPFIVEDAPAEPSELMKIWEARQDVGMLEALEQMNAVLGVSGDCESSALRRIDAMLAMDKLVEGLAACAAAQRKLGRDASLFRVLDPHGRGACLPDELAAFMANCGLSEREQADVRSRLGLAADAALEEPDFVRVVRRDYPSHDSGKAAAFLHDAAWTPTPR